MLINVLSTINRFIISITIYWLCCSFNCWLILICLLFSLGYLFKDYNYKMITLIVGQQFQLLSFFMLIELIITINSIELMVKEVTTTTTTTDDHHNDQYNFNQTRVSIMLSNYKREFWKFSNWPLVTISRWPNPFRSKCIVSFVFFSHKHK